VSIGVAATGPLVRPVRSRSRSLVRHSAALLAAVGAVAILELRILDLDHGTHLLVVLTLVIGTALLFGSGPATTTLTVGGVVSATASIITVDNVFDTPHAYVQLLTYLLVGAAFIVLIPLALRARRQPSNTVAAPSAAAPRGSGPIEPLTAREDEILRLAATGISVEAMARQLFVSPDTVKTHLTHVYAKLGARGRSDAIRAAFHCGCLTPHDICPHRYADGAAEPPVPVTTTRDAMQTM
jgi:DNA-binding CsgD family transcriptional regulator